MTKIRIGVLLPFNPIPPSEDISGEGIARVVKEVIQGLVQSTDVEVLVLTLDWCAPTVRRVFEPLEPVLGTKLEILSQRSPNWFRFRSRYYQLYSKLRPIVDPLGPARPFRRALSRQGLLAALVVGAALGLTAALISGQANRLSIWSWLAVPLGAGACVAVTALLVAALQRIPGWLAAPGPRMERWFGDNRDLLLGEARRDFVGWVSRLPVDVCWVPTLTLPEANLLTKPWVFTFPDMVFREFPTQWIWQAEAPGRVERVRTLLQNATAVTTYSEWVARNQAVQLKDDKGGPISIVRNGPMTLRADLPSGSRSAWARELRAEMQEKGLPQWTVDWDWGNGVYVLAPTQNRPHKNLVSLVRAIEYLNRRKFTNIRLVLTASSLAETGSGVDINHYRTLKGLEHQVVEVPRVSTMGLAVLTALSSLVISPSLFEAGVPFMLSEGTSVDVPVLMAANEVTISEIGNLSGAHNLVFDPFDYMSIARRIEEVLEESDAHLVVQRHLVKEYYANASWTHAAESYAKVFRGAITAR